MAVSPVHTAPGTTTQALQQSHKNTTQAQGTGQTHSTTQTNTAQNTQQHAQVQTTQAPKPVVNGQGQKTGQVLNTTA